MPQRIQRKRSKGWRMPEGAVYVGRPTIWGNFYRIEAEPDGTFTIMDDYNSRTFWCCPSMEQARKIATEAFRVAIIRWMKQPGISLDELRGKDLACWCPLDQPCHADVLLKLANE